MRHKEPKRLQVNPKDETLLLWELLDEGAYIPTTEVIELLEPVFVCFYSKKLKKNVEIPGQVVARRLGGTRRLPPAVKVQLQKNARQFFEEILD